jgi:hypothetical protein
VNKPTIPHGWCYYCSGSGWADTSGFGDDEPCRECYGSGRAPSIGSEPRAASEISRATNEETKS